MPNRWVEHVRAFAAKNKMSYMCAMSDPDIKKGYIPTEKKKQKTEKLEQAMPSTEPTPKNIVIKPRPEPAPVKAKPAKKSRMKRVKDIVKRKFEDRVYYANRFLDSIDAYGVINGKVMMIGTIGDYNSLDLFDEPKSVSKNVRFYNDDVPNKPIQFLNNLQEKE